MSLHTKPMLSADDQIAYMKAQGITFDLVSEDDAKSYLAANNYFFRINLYGDNFPRRQAGVRMGQYEKLDFAALKDLSIIDMEFRDVAMKLCLDIEHYSKLSIINAVMEAGEDGYQVVEDFANKQKAEGTFSSLESEIARNQKTVYGSPILSRYIVGNTSSNPAGIDFSQLPVWVFVEFIPFGKMEKFYTFCVDRFSNSTAIDRTKELLISSVRYIRNAVAHNNCLFTDLRRVPNNNNYTHSEVRKAVSQITTISKEGRKKRLSNERILQICSLLYAHKLIVSSPGVRDGAVRSLHEVVSRMYRNISFYSSDVCVVSFFDFFKKVVDAWFPLATEESKTN